MTRFFYVAILLGALFLTPSQSINAQTKDLDPTELEVLKKIVLSDTIPTVFFKTTISEMNQPLSRHLFYLTDFDICSSLVDADSVKLNKDETNYIVERFSTMEVTNINKLVRDPKNYTLKQLDGHNWFVISMPVVFREGQFAIYYSKSEFSGQFVLMKKMGDAWVNVCFSSVYVE